MGLNTLRRQILGIADEAGAKDVAVAFYDFEHRVEWSLHAERWFHAASTIKVPVLLGVYDAIERSELEPHSRVHVRNRFLSIVDGRPFRVEGGRDANSAVHAAIGRTMTARDLAFHMITTSSNLATNLLVDIVGIEAIRQTIDTLRLPGIEFHRGVEDMSAWEHDVNNRVTARGLLTALRLIEERAAISEAASEEMLEILHAQEFRSGIPAGLPDAARVAHKTGEMSTVAHDAGIVYLADRAPYVLTVLTEWEPDASRRSATIASISRSVYEHVSAELTVDAD
ncbi:MAG TPA: serine hydrolase [Longimicrobiales bacterium]|nr:serine hydrolase [Longimicrobiales bacterium]